LSTLEGQGLDAQIYQHMPGAFDPIIKIEPKKHGK